MISELYTPKQLETLKFAVNSDYFMLINHGAKRTGKTILDNFSEYLPKFKKIVSYDYSKMLQLIAKMEEHGLGYEQAQIEAFYASRK